MLFLRRKDYLTERVVTPAIGWRHDKLDQQHGHPDRRRRRRRRRGGEHSLSGLPQRSAGAVLPDDGDWDALIPKSCPSPENHPYLRVLRKVDPLLALIRSGRPGMSPMPKRPPLILRKPKNHRVLHPSPSFPSSAVVVEINNMSRSSNPFIQAARFWIWFLAVILMPVASNGNPAFWNWASRPVMGWNSWDFYGPSINEERTKAQADYMAANLLSHGWNLITVDIHVSADRVRLRLYQRRPAHHGFL